MRDDLYQEALHEPFLASLGGANLEEPLRRYAEEILRWNRSFNLVSRKSVETTISRLIFESLALGKILRDRKLGANITALDLGSGAGFPAVPLKALEPDWEYHLVEIREKRCFFLERLGPILGWKGYFVHRRDVATLAGPFPGEIPEGPAALRFDLITAKAVGSIPGMSQTIESLLSGGGIFATYSTGTDRGSPFGGGSELNEARREEVVSERFPPFSIRVFEKVRGSPSRE